MNGNIMDIFSRPTADWFQSAFGLPTEVQKAAWPTIAAGSHTLVSAPTGTGKTLSAFLFFIDYLKEQAKAGKLSQELHLLYISPLKSLAGDIRENLRRPLEGIAGEAAEIEVAIRTGDTLPKERQRMVRRPPHILITTPESLYLMLTSKSGQSILKTAKAVILDELHAMIDTKRGAHLMLSVARLDRLCGRNLQRIGLSATIEPLTLAASYLAPDPVVIAAPSMEKKVKIEVVGAMATGGNRRKDPVWEDLAKSVYLKCMGCKSVIAFAEARRFAEKLAYYVNQLGGNDFARVHHGSLSKEQRMEVEQDLREGRLRLLCATSSMELGIDVGDIDQVLQIGCPRTVSGTMQRLGRAGHNPGKVSLMYMYPRTSPESLYCGMTAEIARQGGIEHARPPKMCLDVLAQHLVSMAVGEGYKVDDVMEILWRTYSFREIEKQDVKDVLCMLAGDHEHSQEIPVRPRILYDRLNERVMGDAYSRMLAVSAGGTIPDKGLYTVKTEEGVKLGELDEEFIYESRLGDRFLLGSFAWRIVGQDKDTVVVTQAPIEGARLPFWKGETKGRSLQTSRTFGRIMGRLGAAYEKGTLIDELCQMGLDEPACESTADFLRRQIVATGGLPDDRTILIEHVKDHSGIDQVMVHSLFGRCVNAPLSILMQHEAKRLTGQNIGCVDEEDGFLLYPYGELKLPEGLLYEIEPGRVRGILEAVLPVTPVFSMTFRYNAARALMMGMKRGGRQPLWLQRLRSTQMLDSLLSKKNHPLIRETRRECLEEQWDIEGVLEIIHGIRSGLINVREMYLEVPSPMSLPLQWQIEAAEMYEYSPTTPGIRKAAYEELEEMDKMKPAPEELARVMQRRKTPEDEMQLHSLLMIEGDLSAEEMRHTLEIPVEWLETLAKMGLALYIEPGLWIAAEQREEYDKALTGGDLEAGMHIVRRMLYYRGAQQMEGMQERYFLPEPQVHEILSELCAKKSIVEDGGIYYHAKLYDRARKATVKSLRMQIVTRPPQFYAALMAQRVRLNAPSEEQLKQTMERYCKRAYPVTAWEGIILPMRVKNYNESMLDRLLAQGEFFWQMLPEGNLCFRRYDEIDWDEEDTEHAATLEGEEKTLYQELKKRGASFLKSLSGVLESGMVQETLLALAQKGLVCADSFVPVRQLQNQTKRKKASVRQRVNARVMLLSAGRWDIVHPAKKKGTEELLEQLFQENIVLCRETFRLSFTAHKEAFAEEITWGKALEVLRIWEYTGRARRGYFIAGMSGAQFIRNQDYPAVINVFDQMARAPEKKLQWLNASDPGQVWGKALAHESGRSFLNVPGSAVALLDGLPAVVLERQGKTMRTLEAADNLEVVLKELATAFRKKELFSSLKRLVVKDYPADAAEALKQAGFIREMQDYVLYR